MFSFIFSCGVAIENWNPGSDSDLSRWHREDCDYVTSKNGTSKYIISPSGKKTFESRIIFQKFNLNIV